MLWPRPAPVLLVLLALGALQLAPLTSQSEPRLHTDRTGAHLLKLPKEDDAFGFVVFGDRTGGPVEGIEVLRQAVHDTNLLDPDLVMTVGDLVNGYNGAAKWQEQAKEYKDAMAALRMPWFPVAGNHDIYWRGDGKPNGEHERDFETTFGPLWYAFEHKRCWFVVLYSDESDPATGKKDFNAPECQRISDEQFRWLEATLRRARGARHVFLFLHHPRWIADRYPGADWDRVHALLVQNGNVSAVFAGHIHRMRFDGVRDGIQYFTVASVGAFLEMEAPQAGYLHEYHVVTVRPDGIQLAALPVGAVMDPKAITGAISEQCDLVNERLAATDVRGLAFGTDGAVDSLLQMDFANPADRALELEVVPTGDAAWAFSPDHTHLVVPPGQTATATFAVRRQAGAGPPTLPRIDVHVDYLAPHARIRLPSKHQDLLLPPPPQLVVPAATADGALHLSGKRGDCLRVDADHLRLAGDELTVEAWLCATDLAGRRAVLAKTENSEFGLFCSDGRVAFLVHTPGGYATAETTEPVLTTGRWHHVAGVATATGVRIHVDGKAVAAAPRAGARTPNALPLYVGADPDARGNPMSLFAGRLDEIRISTVARYDAAPFAPAARHAPDADTTLLLHCDQDVGPWSPDDSGRAAHALRRGDVRSGAR